ncbi:Carboxypeptidase regulatory-like domain protein [uncultured archaeon]|nr:Carboxypeptidase regulatory-like domain protein [uncultured archaeon]
MLLLVNRLACISILAAVLIFSGCIQEKKAAEITVIDSDSGTPISGAVVSFSLDGAAAITAKTDSAGTAVFTILERGKAATAWASADGYTDSSPADVSLDAGLNIPLDKANAKPIPKGRHYEDDLVSDSLTGTGAYSQGNLNVYFYKIVLDESGTGAESAFFKLVYYGSMVDIKSVASGQDLRDIFLDGNGNRILRESVIVKSIGYDAGRGMGYADVSVQGK